MEVKAGGRERPLEVDRTLALEEVRDGSGGFGGGGFAETGGGGTTSFLFGGAVFVRGGRAGVYRGGGFRDGGGGGVGRGRDCGPALVLADRDRPFSGDPGSAVCWRRSSASRACTEGTLPWSTDIS